MNKKYIVIGSSAAGTGAVMALSRLDPGAEIVWVTQEAQQPYNKCLLADFVQQTKTKEQINLLPADFFAKKNNIRFLPATRVKKIDRAEKKIVTANIVTANNADGSGEEITYDRLLLAVGVAPIEIPAEIKNCSNVFNAHDLADFETIRAYIGTVRTMCVVKRAVVIGGGLTGLETADALHASGIAVTLVEKNSFLLAPELSAFVQHKISLHAQVRCAVSVQKFEFDTISPKKITGVYLSDNSFVPTSLVICALGARPRIELARQAGLAVERGILVDDFLQTSDQNIWAAGDCAQIEQVLSSTWAEALMQGSCAAQNMAGFTKSYGSGSFIKSVNSRFFNQKIMACGKLTGNSRRIDTGHGSVGYVYEQNNFIQGCLLVGNYSDEINAKLKNAVRENCLYADLIAQCRGGQFVSSVGELEW